MMQNKFYLIQPNIITYWKKCRSIILIFISSTSSFRMNALKSVINPEKIIHGISPFSPINFRSVFDGNAIDFGNLTAAGVMLNGGLADTTRACFAGVNQNPGTNYNTYIDFFTISATGNATDFGDLLEVASNIAGMAGD